MISRRSFLIGAGAFLTAGFLADAKACIAESGKPLLLAPPQPREILFAYEGFGSGEFDEGIRLTLGQARYEEPDPPLWRELVVMEGWKLEKLSDFRRLYSERWITPKELRQSVDSWTWADAWEYRFGPAARAYWLLHDLKLDRRIKGLERAGRLTFYQCPHPGNSAHWVEAKDLLSLSLLQARLRELDVPVGIEIGDASLL